MNVALYARVSSEKQAENDLSIAAQLKALQAYARRKNWIICKEYIDEAESARSANRPAFQEMVASAKSKSKPFEAILVWKHSRFARNREDAIIYKSLLRKFGISVISINEQVDDSPSGKLLEGIIEVIDEFYSLNLAQDTIRGMRENASRGFQNGSVPVGYKAKRINDGQKERTKLEPDEIYAPVIKRIFKMYLEGNGFKSIAQALNESGIKTAKGKEWSNSTIGYVLKNEAYKGTLVYGNKTRNSGKLRSEPIKVENNHPAIIDKETFKKVQGVLHQRRPKTTHPKEVASQYLLSGLLWCGKCGSKLTGASAKSGSYFYYGCVNSMKRGKKACDCKLIQKDEIEEGLITRLKEHVFTRDNMTQLLAIVLDEIENSRETLDEELKVLEHQLTNLRKRLNKLYDSLESGALEVEDIAPRLKELKAQVDELEMKKRQAQEKRENPQYLPLTMETLDAYVEDLADLLKKGSFAEQKSFLRSFIKKISVNHSEVRIDYTIPIVSRKKGKLGVKEVLSTEQLGSPNVSLYEQKEYGFKPQTRNMFSPYLQSSKG